MNYFKTSQSVSTTALDHCDTHQVKQILEYAQILSTVHHRYGTVDDRLYKPTHQHHPVTVWAGDHIQHYRELADVFWTLVSNRVYLQGKPYHKSWLQLGELIYSPPWGIEDNESLPVEAPQCMPDAFKSDDVCASYQAYLNHKFAEWAGRDRPIIAKWSNRPTPEWVA